MSNRPWSPNTLTVHFTGEGSVSPPPIEAPATEEQQELAVAQAWARDLFTKLEMLGQKYAEANSAPSLETSVGESRQLLLSAVVDAVGRALQAVPAAADNAGLTVLHDLQGALLDLHAGKSPPLLQARDVRGAPTTISSGFVRRHAILCVRILMMSGLEETPACAEVANIMRRLGYVGRKKGPFSRSTLTDWIAVLDGHDQSFLGKRLAEIQADVGSTVTKQHAVKLATAYLSHPMMISKSGRTDLGKIRFPDE